MDYRAPARMRRRTTTKDGLEMIDEFLGIAGNVGETFLKSIPISLALAAVFTVLTFFSACNPGVPWWRKREDRKSVV